MKTLLFLMLAGCAVKCEENYYVIEVPENNLRTKTFKVYWNVPTMQCASKKIPFNNLYEKFGIIQNKNDRFKGEKVTILYDPGLFPALFKNESSGRFKFRNGGVPQEGDLDKHLLKFREDLDESVPDVNFNGVGIIDFESWRPVFRQNFGTLQPYKDVSFEIERKLHPWWKKTSIEAEAKSRFTSSARTFMESTLITARTLRPRALWGFYGFPYCFNMAANNMYEQCASKVPEENDQVPWLWSKSTALFPSLYSYSTLSTTQLSYLIRGRVREAARHRQDNILPYFWFRYRDGGFMNQQDLNMALSTIFNSAASGIILWGSSNDVDTVKKCNKLYDYIDNIFGPAIAKYTKNNKFHDETNKIHDIFNTTEEINKESTTQEIENANFDDNLTTKLEVIDPEFHWTPPENYTEDIKKHVEEEINMKLKQSEKPVLNNNGVLIDFLLNYVLNTNNDKDNKKEPEYVGSTTEVNFKLDASQVTNPITNSPIFSKVTEKSQIYISTTTEETSDRFTTQNTNIKEVNENTSEFDIKYTSTDKTTTFEPKYEEVYTKDAYDSLNFYAFTENTPSSEYLIDSKQTTEETNNNRNFYDDYDKITPKDTEYWNEATTDKYFDYNNDFFYLNEITTESTNEDDYFENDMADSVTEDFILESSTELTKKSKHKSNGTKLELEKHKNKQSIFSDAISKLMEFLESKTKLNQEEKIDTTEDIWKDKDFLQISEENLKSGNNFEKSQSLEMETTNYPNLEPKNENTEMNFATTEQVVL